MYQDGFLLYFTFVLELIYFLRWGKKDKIYCIIGLNEEQSTIF